MNGAVLRSPMSAVGRFQFPLSRWLRETRWLLEWILACPFLFCVRRMSDAAALKTARVAGRIAYWLLTRDRRWCLLNLRLVFGENLSDDRRRQLAQAVFEHHALTFCEILRMTPEWLDRNVVVQGLEHARAVRAVGKGMVAVSGHLGNFEIFSAVFNRLGFPASMMTRPLDNPYFERALLKHRARYGSTTLPRRVPGIREALRRLKAGEWIGLAIDQNTAQGGVFVDFCGIRASVPRGASVIARHAGSPVTLGITYRQEDGTHRVIFSPPFKLVYTADAERDIVANTQQFVAALEPHVLRRPEQYHWQHACWRTRPDGSVWRGDEPFQKLARERRGLPRSAPARWACSAPGSAQR